MLKRKIINELQEWSKLEHKKALIVEGARQVGKTTTIREFGKKNYKHFVEINFIKKPIAKQAFDGNLDTDTVVMNLTAMDFGPFVKGKTLVFFDEIQECPNARTAIKFLVEDGYFDFIESGSLLGINYKGSDSEEPVGEIASIPVGYESRLEMYPLDFEEFLWACGISGEIIDVLKKSYNNRIEVPPFIHDRIMECFRKYLVIGGLPEVVNTFVTTHDFNAITKVQSDLVAGYRKDISKYAGSDKVLVKRIFDSIPSQLAKQDKRFLLSEIEDGASRRRYADPTQWLVDAGLANYAINVNAFSLPFANVENRKLFKLYMHDTGIVTYMSLNGKQFSVMNGEIDVNEGALTENFVANELAKKELALHYYDKKSKHELDFILSGDDGIIVVEVKSGKSYMKHASLDYALANEKDNISRAIVLCASNVEIVDDIVYLPLYMAMFVR